MLTIYQEEKTLSWKERQIVKKKEYGEVQHVHLNTADVNSLKLIFSFKSYIKTTQYEFAYHLKNIVLCGEISIKNKEVY